MVQFYLFIFVFTFNLFISGLILKKLSLVLHRLNYLVSAKYNLDVILESIEPQIEQFEFIKITGRVIFSDLDNLLLEPPRLFVFLHVFLSLKSGGWIQHHVLDLVLDVLRPRCKPGHLYREDVQLIQVVVLPTCVCGLQNKSAYCTGFLNLRTIPTLCVCSLSINSRYGYYCNQI